MKIFLDTANIEFIKRWADTGLVDGITTNPTHLSREGGNPTSMVQEICKLLPAGDVSVEITEKEPEAVYKQAKAIAALGKKIVVKIPCHKDYVPIIGRLVDEGVAINITLVFTLAQALMMCKLGVRYVSPFVGRWDDIDADGIQVIADIRCMIDEYSYETELLAASLRHMRHLHDAILFGADVATVPVKLFDVAYSRLLYVTPPKT